MRVAFCSALVLAILEIGASICEQRAKQNGNNQRQEGIGEPEADEPSQRSVTPHRWTDRLD